MNTQNDTSRDTDLLKQHTKRGWAIFPCNGKIPLTSHGYKDASADPIIIKGWLEKYPDANIGIATGKVSDIFVVDIDVKNGALGYESLKDLEREFDKLPATVEVITPSRGRHIYFKYPACGIGCKTAVRPGIDARGDGGYVIAPPSKDYTWEVSSHPDEVAIAEAPKWLIKLLAEDRKEKTAAVTPGEPIGEGRRNVELTSIAGGMRKRGCTVEEIEAALFMANKRCVPPLPDKEIKRIAESVGQYKADELTGLDDIAKNVCQERMLLWCGGIWWEYVGGVYKEISKEQFYKYVIASTQKKLAMAHLKAVLFFAEIYSFIPVAKLNADLRINLSNGIFDMSTGKIGSHDPAMYSTIQLPIDYDPEAKCDLWLKTLNEIFENDAEKIAVLQEFFGLCFSRDTKYSRTLMCVGSGANGKSVLLSIMEHTLGVANCSAVPLSKFSDNHYLFNIFGKLANISYETCPRPELYEEQLKAVVTGDSIECDRKYGQPIKFRPFAKCVFAMNQLPAVNDKSDAFFRRLLILRFCREFSEVEQNKNLASELKAELSGIFNWALAGWRRLEKRTYFEVNENMRAEINNYRNENNSVLLFVNECCDVESAQVSYTEKAQLYKAYKTFCEDDNYKALGKIRFGKELTNRFKSIKEGRSRIGAKAWDGIDLVSAWTDKESCRF